MDILLTITHIHTRTHTHTPPSYRGNNVSFVHRQSLHTVKLHSPQQLNRIEKTFSEKMEGTYFVSLTNMISDTEHNRYLICELNILVYVPLILCY